MSKILKEKQGSEWILSEETEGNLDSINIQIDSQEIRMGCYIYILKKAFISRKRKLNGLSIIPFYFKFFSLSDPLIGMCNYLDGIPKGDFYAFSEKCRLSDAFYSDLNGANHDFLENIYNHAIQFYKTQSQKQHEERFIYGQYDEKGQLNGKYIEQTGSCKVVCQYKNGILEGAWKKYGRYIDGDRLIEEKIYKSGQEVDTDKY